jgi:hypothetical protein
MTKLEFDHSGPFYPCQLEDGSTYVMDNRRSVVVATMDRSADTVDRWRAAKLEAARRNAEWVQEQLTLSRRLRLGFTVLVMVVVTLTLWRVNFG